MILIGFVGPPTSYWLNIYIMLLVLVLLLWLLVIME